MKPRDDEAMLEARRIVEQHIRHCGYINHPDLLKEEIARSIRTARIDAEAGLACAKETNE